VALVGTLLMSAVAVAVASAAPAGAGSTSAHVKAAETEAKHELLVKSDFPSGWNGQGSVKTVDKNGDAPDFPGGTQLVGCLGISQSLLNLNTPQATSPNFQSKSGMTSAQDVVDIFPSTNVAHKANAVITNPKVPSCLTAALQGSARQSITSAIGNGVTVGTIAVVATSPGMLTSRASGFTVSFPATSQGVTLSVQISLISIIHDKSDTNLTLTSVGSPFLTSLAKHLETVAYGRT
jgi:hypothetical protein